MNETLNEFGELYIREVRDNTIFVLENILTGEMKAPADQLLHQKIASLSAEQIEILKETTYSMIDLALHNMLFMFEQEMSWVISKPNAGVESLAAISDGLCGELYTADGWIQKFSAYPSSL